MLDQQCRQLLELLAFAGALFSKESAAAFVGYVVAVTLLGAPEWPDRQRMRRAAAAARPTRPLTATLTG